MIQVQNVRRKCFTGLAIEECVTNNNKKAVIQRPGSTPHGLLLGCMAGVLNRVEAEVRESAELLILSQPSWTHSEEMRQKLNWMTLEKRRVMASLCMVHRCVLKEYSMKSLSKRIQFTSNGTRGVGKLFPNRLFQKFIYF